MKNTITASVADIADETSATGAFGTVFDAIRERLRKAAAARSLRRQLGGLDDALLRDIGISEDEIWRLRASQTPTPQAWM